MQTAAELWAAALVWWKIQNGIYRVESKARICRKKHHGRRKRKEPKGIPPCNSSNNRPAVCQGWI